MIAATFTTDQIAEKLQASPRWVRAQVAKGHVTPLRLGQRMRFTDDDLDVLIASMRTTQPVAPARRRRRRF